MTKPYLSYYGARTIIPVDQSDVDVSLRLARRLYLHQRLGLAPDQLRGLDIVEFGPGTGDNAIVLSNLGARHITLVDGNLASIEAIKNRLDAGLFRCPVTLVHADFTQSNHIGCFDVVVAEGCIPFQRLPGQVFEKLANYIRPGGFGIFTSVSKSGLISELLRRFFVREVLGEKFSPENAENFVSIFSHHLSTLNTVTRNPKDWINDAIFHPWFENGAECFDPVDLISLTGVDFFHASCHPRPLDPGLFYKAVNTDPIGVYLEELKRAIIRSEISCIDHTLTKFINDEMSFAFYSNINDVFDCFRRYELEPNSARKKGLMSALTGLSQTCEECQLDLARGAINEVLSAVTHTSASDKFSAILEFRYVPKFWGRCQYYHLIRRNRT